MVWPVYEAAMECAETPSALVVVEGEDARVVAGEGGEELAKAAAADDGVAHRDKRHSREAIALAVEAAAGEIAQAADGGLCEGGGSEGGERGQGRRDAEARDKCGIASIHEL